MYKESCIREDRLLLTIEYSLTTEKQPFESITFITQTPVNYWLHTAWRRWFPAAAVAREGVCARELSEPLPPSAASQFSQILPASAESVRLPSCPSHRAAPWCRMCNLLVGICKKKKKKHDLNKDMIELYSSTRGSAHRKIWNMKKAL